MEYYVYTVWTNEEETEEQALDGSGSEFGLDEIAPDAFEAEDVRRRIVAEFPSGADDEDPVFTVLRYVKINGENGDILAEFNYND